MTLRCEKHTSRENEEIIKRPAVAVCHHCGRPLCGLVPLSAGARSGSIEITKEQCGYTIPDPVFAPWPSARQSTVVDELLLGKLVNDQPLTAHCRDCLKQHHQDFFQILKN